MILTEGPAAVQRLIDRGAQFDAGPDGLLRTREGGHSANRVIHAGGDATGAEIERALLAVPGLPAVLAGHQALDVVLDGAGRARGVSVLDPDGAVGLIRSAAVVLATGGAGHLYAATTNPGVATGDGLAMALRAGAALADVEFMQFHPTVLWTGPGRPRPPAAGHRGGPRRGCGADRRRRRPDHAGRASAGRPGAARCGVAGRFPADGAGARAVSATTSSWTPPGSLRPCSPAGSRRCPRPARWPGSNPTTDPIPVAPAAHYHCGGVLTDLDGRTTVPGLFAVGEVARTGLHGANRLASNSLLEGLVMGERAAAAVGAEVALAAARPAELILTAVPGADPAGRAELQATMSRSAGIGRDLVGLLAAQSTAARLGSRRRAGRRPVVGGDGEPGPGRRRRCWPPPRRAPSPAAATSAPTTRSGCRPGSGRCWSGRPAARSTSRSSADAAVAWA